MGLPEKREDEDQRGDGEAYAQAMAAFAPPAAGQTTLPLYIWAMIRRPMTPEINAISTILLSVSILFILVSFGIAQKRK